MAVMWERVGWRSASIKLGVPSAMKSLGESMQSRYVHMPGLPFQVKY